MKRVSGQYEYRQALVQTAKYAKKMRWTTVWLVFFTEQIDDKNREKYEVTHRDDERGVVVETIFVQTGWFAATLLLMMVLAGYLGWRKDNQLIVFADNLIGCGCVGKFAITPNRKNHRLVIVT